MDHSAGYPFRCEIEYDPRDLEGKAGKGVEFDHYPTREEFQETALILYDTVTKFIALSRKYEKVN